MSEEPRTTQGFRLTFVDGQPILVIGKGNHDCERLALTETQVNGFVLDALPWLLSASRARPPVS